jgi:hypothetical protein
VSEPKREEERPCAPCTSAAGEEIWHGPLGCPQRGQTKRIRWEEALDGEGLGYVGSLDRPAFRLWPPDEEGDRVLLVYLAGSAQHMYHDDGEDSLTALKAKAEELLEEFVSSLGAVFEPEPDESAAFQLGEARDVLARWDAEQEDGEPVFSREKVLADQVRTLLAIVDQAPAPEAARKE